MVNATISNIEMYKFESCHEDTSFDGGTGIRNMMVYNLSMHIKYSYTKEEIQKAIFSTSSMRKASEFLEIPYTSFKSLAIKHGVWVPNQGRKGIERGKRNTTHKTLLEVLENKSYRQTRRIKELLYEFNYKIPKCEKCGIENWCGEKITFDLHHIDGNKYNNRLSNLEILCPNCHSLTDTYKNKTRPPILQPVERTHLK